MRKQERRKRALNDNQEIMDIIKTFQDESTEQAEKEEQTNRLIEELMSKQDDILKGQQGVDDEQDKMIQDMIMKQKEQLVK